MATNGRKTAMLIATRMTSALVETFAVTSIFPRGALPSHRKVFARYPLAVLFPTSSSSSSSTNLASFHTSVLDFPREKPEIKTRLVPSKKKYHPVDLETSKAYLKSDAFVQTYQGLPIWHPTLYRRNFRGPWNPPLTRPDCVIHGYLCGNPCPICRDDHLFVHHENLELLKHFIEPETGKVLSHRQTNICLLQHSRVQIAVGRARDRGLLEMRVPLRDYDYSDYYSKELLVESQYEDIISSAENAFLARTKDVAERQLGRNDIVLADAFSLVDDDVDHDHGDDDSDDSVGSKSNSDRETNR